MHSLAAGFIKPCLGPMLCDQSPVTRNEIIILKSGERAILSPQVTVQRYLLIFYTCINIGELQGVEADEENSQANMRWI